MPLNCGFFVPKIGKIQEVYMFKFELKQFVEIRVSGEMGYIKSRSESCNHCNQYFIHHKAADGRAVESWLDEEDITAVTDDRSPGQPVYMMNEEDLPEGAVVE